MMQYETIENTVYHWFGSNNTAGSGADGSGAVWDVRLAGAAAGAAPVLSGSATLLTHANYTDGSYEIAVAATAANGFAAGSVYAVFCTLLVDSQNPTGFAGAFKLGGVPIVGDLSATMKTSVSAAVPTLAQILTTALTESYRANGAAPTLAQAIFELLAHLGEASIAGTVKTIKKIDHATAAETFTLNDATTPTSITRAS